MKNILLLLLFAGCSQAGSITGTYVKHVESDYSVGEDTVFITAGNNGQFVLERHTGYQRISYGKMQGRQLKIQHSVLAPSANNQYQDTKTGAILTFEQNKLLLGTAEYQKIQ